MSTESAVFDKQGNKKTLSNLLAKGGEGSVFPLDDRDGVLIKIYHPEILNKRGLELFTKTEAMIELRQKFSNHAVSWPLLSVFDARKQWVGYAMYRAQGIPLSRLAHAMLYLKYFPELSRINIVDYLISLLNGIKGLNDNGVRIGDYNFNNILCLPESNKVTLIDCDSYQIEHQNKVYPCPVGSPDMTPPEHQGKSFDKIYRTEESENFSIAIVLFKCLMLGRHPYDAVGGEDPISNIKAGRFPYGTGNSGIPEGPWFNIWSHMPHRLKSMFIETFTHGADTPSARPSMAEWLETLELYKREMLKGWHEKEVKPIKPKQKGYNGTRSLPQA